MDGDGHMHMQIHWHVRIGMEMEAGTGCARPVIVYSALCMWAPAAKSATLATSAMKKV